jgi:hypothetical protein
MGMERLLEALWSTIIGDENKKRDNSLFLQRNQFVEVDSNFLKKIGFESYG